MVEIKNDSTNPWADPGFIQERVNEIEIELNKRRTPMKKRIEFAMEQLALHKEVTRKSIEETLSKMWTTRRKKRQELIDESEKLPPGSPDYTGRLHRTMQKVYASDRQKIADREMEHKKDIAFQKRKGAAQKRGVKKVKRGWGPRRDMTRDDYIRSRQRMITRGYETLVNWKLTDSEEDNTENL